MDETTPEAPAGWAPAAPPGGPAPRMRRANRWLVGIGVALLAPVAVLSLGISAIVWVPLLLALGVAMCGVWAARRRRQRFEGRDSGDVRDPARAERAWPSDGIIDDRLPER
ncbi:MAG TPA: hypothetical protein VE987_17140 [Polyangiaceae bacterium]|nr:hypothetical protein [Polyangiaceae bacterium]